MAKPSFRRRRLVTALRNLRDQAGYGITEAAQAAGFSQTKLSKIEALQVAINGDDTYTLCKTYGADDTVTDALVQLARDAKKRGWWYVYDDSVLGSFSDFIEMEEDAQSVREFEADVIPGQLQTEGYATAVIGRAGDDIDNGTIQQRVKLRMDRQARLRSRRTDLWVVLGEAALRQPVGGPQVMAAQLEHLTAMATEPGITIQVLPMSNRGHPAMGVPFTLIELRDGTQYVYLDSVTGGAYMEEPADTAAYGKVWARLQATALDFDSSATMIERIGREHRSTTDDYQRP